MIVSSLHKAEKTQDIGKESRYWNTELRAWSLAYDRALRSKPLTSEPGVGLRDHEVHCPLSNRVPGPTLIPGVLAFLYRRGWVWGAASLYVQM